MADAAVALAVRRIRLELLLQKFGPRATVAAMPFATVVWVLFYLHRPGPGVLAWAAVVYGVAAMRYLHMRRIARHMPLPDDRIDATLDTVTVYIFLTGVTWGLAPWLVMSPDDGVYKALMGAFVLGILSTAGSFFATHRKAVLAFHAPAAAGLIGAQVLLGGPLDWALAVVTLQYVVINTRWTFRQADLLAEALTSRFENEDLARRLSAQVELAQEADREKSRFLASASHDLRQPLHAVSLFTSALERAPLDAPTRVTVDRLGHSVRMLQDSLDAMLDISRLDAGAVQPHVRPVPVHELFLKLQGTFSARAQEQGLQLRVRAPGAAAVMTDPQLLERLLGNLVDNALKYTPAGGVLVTARGCGPHAPPGTLCIEVVDTGIGIPPAHRERIFDEFYQVDNPQRDRTRGLGIGLAIVRRLAGLLAHPVVLQSRPGRGTRFRVQVPLASPLAVGDAQGPAAAPPSPLMERLPRRVLVLDDERDNRDALTTLLAAHGCEVHSAGDVQQAEDMLARLDVQAVVADFRLLGERSGLDFLLALRARPDPIRGLLVTGETAPGRIAAIRASGVPCLHKPVRAEALLAALAHQPSE